MDQVPRRSFLKLAVAVGGAVALPLSMGNKVQPGCSGDSSDGARNEDAPKRNKGGRGKKAPENEHKRRPPARHMPSHEDDNRRYKCEHPSHKTPYIIFGTEAMLAHIKRYPSHHHYIHPYH